MKYICDAPKHRTWFRLESETEAEAESELMQHAVAKHFAIAWTKARASFVPASSRYIEQEIGLKAHIQREMPLFLTWNAHVPVPLEVTYQAAWEEVPRRWQQVLLDGKPG